MEDVHRNRDPRITVFRQTTDLTVNNSTTFVNTEIVIPVVASGIYVCYVYAEVISNVAADCKYAFTVPAGGAGWKINQCKGSTLGVYSNITGPAAQVCGGTNELQYMHCIFVVGSTAGNYTLQFAQNAAHASDSKFLTNSSAVVHRVA